MPRCASCASENPAGFRFCGTCGSPLSSDGCPDCGFVNPQGQRFCGRCGAHLSVQLTTAVRPEQGERKLATVMFADVVGFTALAEVSDPETLARAVDSALRPLADVVVEHGGTIDKYLGDALMALFGVPVAHDDDAERAVAAALKMRDSAVDLRFSIGINSGEVMVTSVGDGDAITVIGDAVNVASRLESTAGAGEILVGPLTAELVAERFLLREREPALLKGKSQPVAVFEVLGPRAGAEGDGAAAFPPLAGRLAELDFLWSCWRRSAERSRAQVLVLTGEAGVGKTRLAEELAFRVRDESDVVRAACPGYGALVAGRLALELGRGLGFEDLEGRPGATPELSFDDHDVWRLRRQIAERAQQRPQLIVIDDLQNATASDLDPLVQLCSRVADLPVTLLLTGRPQPDAWLTRFPGATTLHLDPLSAGDAAGLAASLAGELPLPPAAAAALAVQAGGNPLHLRELVRLLTSHGGAARANTDIGTQQRPALPPTLQAVLAARLDALQAADKTVLQDISIFSDGATTDEIAALSNGEPQGSLDRLLHAGLIRRRDERYEVEDPLLREVAYEQLPHATRGRRHRRAAAVAATAVGRARHLGLAARYLPSDQELRREAAEELGRTGAELLAASRFRDGITLAHRAVELGHDDPETLVHLAEAEIDVGRAAAAIGVLERVKTNGDPRIEARVLHARGNAARLVDLAESDRLLAEAAHRWSALGDEGKRAWALTNRGMTLFSQGRVEEAAAAHDAALAIFRDLEDRAGAAAAGQSLALASPDDPRVPSWLDDGLRLAEETGDLTQERNALIPLVWSRFIRSQLGGPAYIDAVLHDADRLVGVSVELGDAPFEVQGHCLAALMERLSGRLDAAAARVLQAQLAARDMVAPSEGLLEATDFMVRAARGGNGGERPDPVQDVSPLGLVSDSITLEALALGGHVDAAIAFLAASPLGSAPSISPFFARLVGIIRGAVLVIAGRCDDAEPDLRAAREVAVTLGAYPTEAAATALLAEIEARRGNAEKATSLLKELGDDPGGIAGLLLERARHVLGDAAAGARLHAAAATLSVPGLTLGL